YLELYLGDTRKRHVLNGVGTVVFIAGCMLLPGSHRMVQFLVDQRYATYWVVKILTLAFIFGAGLCYTTIAEVAAVRRLLGKEDDANFQRTLFPQMFRVNAGALIIGLFLFAGLTLPVRFRSEGFLF
ncbi:MAG TPA: hypothetical protein PKO06_01500, partial [Candidatus Ozemobacteraceae bacterium]|nr:hypothetical protein [Candidatus Ozemobacteraceae bacterium]